MKVLTSYRLQEWWNFYIGLRNLNLCENWEAKCKFLERNGNSLFHVKWRPGSTLVNLTAGVHPRGNTACTHAYVSSRVPLYRCVTCNVLGPCSLAEGSPCLSIVERKEVFSLTLRGPTGLSSVVRWYWSVSRVMIFDAIVLEPKLKGYLNSYFPNEHWVWLRIIYRHRFSERMEMETLRKY